MRPMRMMSACCAPLLICTGVAAQQPAPVPVTVQPAVMQRADLPAVFNGMAEAISVVELRARVEGAVESIEFSPGARVAEDDLMFRLDSELYDAAVSAAQARLAQAQTEQNEAQKEHERQTKLTHDRVSSAAMLDKAEAALSAAQASVESAAAALKQAQISQAFATIRAPISGHAEQAQVSRGDLVGPQFGPLVRIVQLSPIRVRFSLPEPEFVARRQAAAQGAGAPESGRRYTLELANGAAHPEQGAVEYEPFSVDTATGAASVALVFDNKNLVLTPGQHVRVVVSNPDAPMAPVAPTTAVLQDAQGRYLFVVDKDGVAHQRRIKTGLKLRDGWVALDGLKEGERVVVAGAQRLRDGAQVAIAGDDKK